MAQNKKTNFIKYSEKVFLLSDEDSNISLDIPFKNSISGKIKISIISKSPIFIRNHYIQGDDFYLDKDNNKISTQFCHYNGTRYIPSTSIKGMIRNTLEIMSYAKLGGKTQKENIQKKIKDKSSLHYSEKLDLSEAIFGTTNLKGRVIFSHFKEIGKANTIGVKSEILGTPHPKENKFGWKNYPILDNTKAGKGGKNDNVKSQFEPLQKGAKFEGYLTFHNLRDFELGAILSAITFHNTQEVYHNIGLAKSLGYGQIKVDLSFENINKYLRAFEEKLNIELFNGKIEWHKSSYIKELFNKHSKNKKNPEPLSDLNSINELLKNYVLEKQSKMQQEWERIKNSNDLNIYQKFQDKYKQYLLDDIKQHIESFKEKEELNQQAKQEWETVKKSKSVEELKDFLIKYDNYNIDEINIQIDKILKAQQKREEAKKQQENKKKNLSKNILSKIKKHKR